MAEKLEIQENEQVALIEEIREACLRFQSEMHKVIVGQDEVIEHMVCCLLGGGHCLVQGVPGLAKTMIVHSLSRVLDMDFKRIQFTPDLMPSDITGSEIIHEDPHTRQREFRFMRGPVFTNILLADEINRTPPKTQSALLEAMQESEVTAGGVTYRLDEPFFVIATQNPIEQEGTYPLPEAALDRFMFMVHIDYPDEANERKIVEQTCGRGLEALSPVADKQQVMRYRRALRTVPVSSEVIDYCVALCRGTRPGGKSTTTMVREYVQWGASPRAGQCLAAAAKTRAVLHGRLTPTIEDVVHIARPVLRHRIITNFNADADGVGVEDILDDLLKRVCRS